MIKRFFELKEFISAADDKIAELMPSRREENKLQSLLDKLKDFESTSLTLQSADGVSLLDVRDLFDALVEQYPSLSGYLSADADIVHDPAFESACVSVLMGKKANLSVLERGLLRPFEVQTGEPKVVQSVAKMGFAEKALKKRKGAFGTCRLSTTAVHSPNFQLRGALFLSGKTRAGPPPHSNAADSLGDVVVPKSESAGLVSEHRQRDYEASDILESLHLPPWHVMYLGQRAQYHCRCIIGTPGNGTIVEQTTMEYKSDYLSGMRDKFSSSAYIIQAGYNEETCTTFENAYGFPAFGNCAGSYQERASVYIIGILNGNGSAVVKYYRDSNCATFFEWEESASEEALTTHSCGANRVRWYSSKDDTSSSSSGSVNTTTQESSSSGNDIGDSNFSGGSSTSSSTQEGSSSGHDTGATVGIVCGVVILLLVIGAVTFYRRRRSQGKHGGRWKEAVPSAAINGQTGLWNDDVITAKRIPRDKVKVKKLLSRSAYGEVFTGVFNDQQVAVKMLLPSTRGNLQHATDFLTEAKLTASLDHPHIVTFVGVVWDSVSDLCVVLEFMDGGDLRTLLKNYEATEHPAGVDREKATIALHVCHALAYLHSLMPPVIHRDLKSRNILLDQNKEAKLTDVGTARERIDTTMTAAVGTSLWMAPEVLLGEKYDVKADMFSFGVVLSELDVHTLPYAQVKQQSLHSVGHQISDTTLLQKIMAGEVRVEFSNASSASLVELGCACVDIAPKNRPSAAEALYRLQIILQQDLAVR